MADLYSVLTKLIDKRVQHASRGGTSDDLYQPGTVVAVNGDGTYDVSVNGRVMTANPETDLPLAVNQRVYVSMVRNGKPLVHGPR